MVEGSIHPPCLLNSEKLGEIYRDLLWSLYWKECVKECGEGGRCIFLLIICCRIQTVSYMNWEFYMDGSSCWTFPYLLSSFTGTACFTHLCFLTHPPSRRYITLCLSGTQIAVWVDKRNGAHILSPWPVTAWMNLVTILPSFLTITLTLTVITASAEWLFIKSLRDKNKYLIDWQVELFYRETHMSVETLDSDKSLPKWEKGFQSWFGGARTLIN